jgi:hypothetical protein
MHHSFCLYYRFSIIPITIYIFALSGVQKAFEGSYVPLQRGYSVHNLRVKIENVTLSFSCDISMTNVKDIIGDHNTSLQLICFCEPFVGVMPFSM